MKSKVIKYREWIFEVDFLRTKEICDKTETGSSDGCGCNECKNFTTNREQIYPSEVKRLLADLGIDYRKESEVYHMARLDSRTHCYGGWFHFKGRITEGEDCRVHSPNDGSSMNLTQVNKRFSIGFTRGSAISYFDESESSELIQVEFQTNVDWTIDNELAPR